MHSFVRALYVVFFMLADDLVMSRILYEVYQHAPLPSEVAAHQGTRTRRRTAEHKGEDSDGEGDEANLQYLLQRQRDLGLDVIAAR